MGPGHRDAIAGSCRRRSRVTGPSLGVAPIQSFVLMLTWTRRCLPIPSRGPGHRDAIAGSCRRRSRVTGPVGTTRSFALARRVRGGFSRSPIRTEFCPPLIIGPSVRSSAAQRSVESYSVDSRFFSFSILFWLFFVPFDAALGGSL